METIGSFETSEESSSNTWGYNTEYGESICSETSEAFSSNTWG